MQVGLLGGTRGRATAKVFIISLFSRSCLFIGWQISAELNGFYDFSTLGLSALVNTWSIPNLSFLKLNIYSAVAIGAEYISNPSYLTLATKLSIFSSRREDYKSQLGETPVVVRPRRSSISCTQSATKVDKKEVRGIMIHICAVELLDHVSKNGLKS